MSGSVLTDTAPAALPFVARDATSAAAVGERASATAFAGALVLMLAAPFERIEPLLRLPGQSISTLEAALLAAFAAWGLALGWSRCLPTWRTPLTAPWLVLIAAMTVASIAAPADRLNALHMTGRMAAAFGVYLLAVNGITTPGRSTALVATAIAAAVVVSVLAVLEYLTIPAVLQWLKAFRTHLMTVGALVRAGGSLQYPTIASMYLEIVFALGVALMVASRDEGRRVRAASVFAALLLMAYAITLTFTRAGLILIPVLLVCIGSLRARRRGVDAGVRLVALLGVSVIALFLGSRSLDSIWLRFTTEGHESWYRADIDAPAELTLQTGALTRVPVSVTNRGRLDWNSQGDSPFFLSYHWMLDGDDRYVVFDGVRTPFEATVSPGERALMAATVRAPRRPGRYRLVWDIVQERRTWFSDEPGASVVMTRADVEGPLLAGAPQPFPRPKPGWRPGRLVLWRAALQMIAAHPLLGVGPDNFRLTYTQYAGRGTGDTRTHSNNMYLEVLAGGGIVTALAFVWLIWRAVRLAVDASRAGTHEGRSYARPTIADGVAAACLAIALHGVVDSFLSFAPTYILFSLTLGLAAACARGMETGADAHRV